MDVSRFFYKEQHQNFPIIPLHRFLKARHGDKPAEIWVAMIVVVLDDEIMKNLSYGDRGECLILLALVGMKKLTRKTHGKF